MSTKDTIVETIITVVYILIIANYVRKIFLTTKYYTRNVKDRVGLWHWKKASKQFGVSIRKLKKMRKTEIKKIYREKAMETHPDHGGNAEDFNKLNEAYQFAYGAAHA